MWGHSQRNGAGMKARTRLVLGLVMVVMTTACGAVERLTGSDVTTSVGSGGGTMEVNGVPNEPTTDKVVALRLESPLGIVAVETYDSQIGPCYDVVFPDGRREANCLLTSGIDPSRSVTGGPEGSIEGLNGATWNAGLTESGIGMFHHGLAHPTVRTVTVEPDDGSTARSFPVVRAPNVDGLAVYLAWSDEGVDRYRLGGYDADGCLIDQEPIPLGNARPGGAGRDCSQRLPDQLNTVELLPTE